jgi:hypothetical protein
MLMMDFEAWTVDLKTLTATHSSGFRLEIEGNPKDPNAVNPGRFPKELSGIEQVRLLRTGVEAIAKAATGQGSVPPTAAKPRTSPHKPTRPVLSLKSKRSPEEA